jgi:DNA (cytosine-5)-methyltransferase 1
LQTNPVTTLQQTKQNPLTHLSLFSGIGGFEIAAQKAGFTSVGFSEIDPYCCALLAERWPNITNYGDIRNTRVFIPLRGRVTVLSAGPPCQPVSLAGQRRGARDDRWLWSTTLDVVERIEPDWCLFENPIGLTSMGEFEGILLHMEKLNYQIRIYEVPANAVGAKHLRYRVFIVAHTHRDRCPMEQRSQRGDEEENGQYGEVSRSGSQPETMADPMRTGLSAGASSGSGATLSLCGSDMPGWVWGETDPRIYGGFDGLPNRRHRIKALGNGVVPQQAYPFFEAIAQTERYDGGANLK